MKDPKKVLIVSKMTELEFDEFRYGAAVDQYYAKNNTDVKALEKNHKYHYESLDKVISCFMKHGVNPGLIKKQGMDRRDFREEWDLIVPVGGDGTFMDVARYILDDTLVFGIKSSPNSVGGHYNTNFSNAEENIERLLSGDYKVEKRARIEGIVKNEFRITDLALNEIFIGDKYNPGYAKLEIYVDNELFKTGSSGLVVSTFHGRTGWYDHIPVIEKDPAKIKPIKETLRKAGLNDNVRIICSDADFKESEKEVVRYKLREGKNLGQSYGYDYGILKPSQELKVVSRIFVDGCVSFDGNKPTRPRHRMYDLHLGAKVTVRISDKPLHVVGF